MRLAVLVLLPALLIAGCLDGSESLPAGGESQGVPSVEAPQDSQTPVVQPSAEAPFRSKFYISAVRDMLVFNGKLYFIGSTRKEAATVYEYVDEKTPPKRVLRLGWGSENDFDSSSGDPRLKDKGMELNSLVEYGGVLYAAGETGLFKMKQDGSWEMLDTLVPPGARKEDGISIVRMKKFSGGVYAAATYGKDGSGPSGRTTFGLLKFTGDGWHEVYDTLSTGQDLAEYAGEVYLTGDGTLEKLVFEDGKAAVKSETATAPESLDVYFGIGRFGRVGSDGNAVYVCGDGKKVFRYAGGWMLAGQVGDSCEFFDKAGNTLYFGVQHGKYEKVPQSEVGLFKIEGGGIKQVASGEFVSPSAIIEYNGELIVGGHENYEGTGGIYKITGGKLQKIEYYEG